MRIIGGEARGRRLIPFKERSIRPTSDLIREAIFNTIISKGLYFEPEFEVLDLFAGSGALGIEALSRGAGRVIFVDNDKKAIRIIKKNLEHCGYSERAETFCVTVSRSISILKKKECAFDLIFMDPPYEKGLVSKTLKEIAKIGLLKSNGWLIVEHSRKEVPQDYFNNLVCREVKSYGQTLVSYFTTCNG